MAFMKEFQLTDALIDTADALKFQRLGHDHPNLNTQGVIAELKQEVTSLFPSKVDKQQRILALIEIWETKIHPCFILCEGVGDGEDQERAPPAASQGTEPWVPQIGGGVAESRNCG